MNYKSWIVFFNKEGISPCGSDGVHCLPLTVKNAEKRLFSKGYYIPSFAHSYIILTDYQFRLFSYKDIQNYHEKYGKTIIK